MGAGQVRAGSGHIPARLRAVVRQMEDKGQDLWTGDRTELLNRKGGVGELSGVRDVELVWRGGGAGGALT